MPRDFTFKTYDILVKALLECKYVPITYEQYADGHRPDKLVILRHDVDRKPWNAVEMARIEATLGVVASYYYRVVPEAYDEEVIKQVTAMGHECGYHYEDMDLAHGDIDKAHRLYLTNLANFRRFYPVRTVCMHGSPMSKWDNREVWSKYDVHAEGIVGEPFMDIDYDTLFYVTDTGRGWNNTKAAVRDKVKTKFHFSFTDTYAFIDALRAGTLPKHLMFNTHPHRWNDAMLPWAKELVLQNAKNVVKQLYFARKAAKKAAKQETQNA